MANKKRNRIITLLFLPIAIILFILGWIMLTVGLRDEQTKQSPHAKTASQDDGITIIPMIPEEIENN
jgi:amino acid transporter